MNTMVSNETKKKHQSFNVRNTCDINSYHYKLVPLLTVQYAQFVRRSVCTFNILLCHMNTVV